MTMTSNKPYLIRAFYDWIVDNQYTPYMSVDAYYPGVEVPQDYVNDGQIVLNLVPRAITELVMNNEQVSFSTRFGGVPSDIRLPIQSIMGIYARENGQGMMFQSEDNSGPEPSGPSPVKSVSTADKSPSKGNSSGETSKKPSLRVVK
ncbi:MAG: ClpXP protease specificity-enhancing factor [Porticoccus sp.]|nr:ClpXP protease specificity-enhancing factor [Porticoccus sp.]